MPNEDVKGFNIKLGLDASEVDTDLEKISSGLSDTSRKLTDIKGKLKFNADDVNLWKEKQSLLTKQIEATRQKIQAQNKKLEETKRLVDTGALDPKAITKLKKEINSSYRNLDKLNDELALCSKRIEEIPVEKIGKVGSAMTKYVTMPVIAATAAIAALSVETANEVDEVYDMAQNLRMSTEELYSWHYAAEILAVDSEQLNKAFTKFNVVMGDISAGTASSNITTALNKIGLSIDDLKGKDINSAFTLVRNSLASLEDASLRVAVANELFGDKMGTSLQQLLSASGEEVDALIEKIQELGVITDESGKISGELTDKISDLKYALKSASVELMTAAIPLMEQFIDFLINTVIPNIKSLIGFWNNLSSAGKTFILVLIGLLAVAGPILSFIKVAIPVFKALKLALVGVGEGGKAAGIGLSFATFGIGLLIAVLVMALMQSESFRDLLMQIGNLLAAVIGSIMPLLKPVISMLQNTLLPILNVLVQVLSPIFDLVAGICEALAFIVEITGLSLFGGSSSSSSTIYNTTNDYNNSYSFYGYDTDQIMGQINTSFGGMY